MSRTIGYSIIPLASANRGTGPMSIIWWTIGVSGIEAPGHPREPRAPGAAADHDALGLDVAARRAHPPHAAAARRRCPSTSVLAADGQPRLAPRARASACRPAASRRRRRPGVWKPPRISLSSMKGTSSLDLGGREQRDRLDPPRLRPTTIRRVSSCMRSSVRAISIPPLSMKTPSSPVLAHALERQRGHLLRVVDGEDEVRGVAGRAARVRQRALVDQHELGLARAGARWWARLLPTIPAPITTIGLTGSAHVGN